MIESNSISDDALFEELKREECISAVCGNTEAGLQPEDWKFQVSHSQRAGAAALMGVYGPEVQADKELIESALRDELTEEEVTKLESLRPLGQEYRFGKNGRFGWI